MVTASARHLLRGVPRVGFYRGIGPRCPEDIPFPSTMRALMEFLRERDFGCRACDVVRPGCKVSCSYAFFVGVTGVAAFLNWKPGWAGDNTEIMYMSDDVRAPFERAFHATGYEYETIERDEGRNNEAVLKQRIISSIQKSRPVLAFGPIGPPEATLITGYDEGGDVLIGWSFFQDSPAFNGGGEFEPSGQFRARDWFNYPPGFSFIVVGQKKTRPPWTETYRQALEWLLEVTHTSVTFGDRHNGLAAYTAWSDQIVRDEDFPDDETILRQRYEVHSAAVGLVAEARWYGSQFLIQANDPEILPFRMSEHLLHASACYGAEHALMWELWRVAGSIANPDGYRRFADPAVRRQMVPIIRQARENNALAAEHIEQALECS